MKKFLKKYKKIITIIFVILVSLLIICLSFANKISKKKATKEPTSSYETFNLGELETENFVENANDTINIDELANKSENTLVEPANNTVNNTTNNNKITKDSTKSNKSGTPYYIKVNYGAQVVTIYTKDDSGNYTVPVKAMVCSTGVATPKSGVYTIPRRWEWLGLQGDVYGNYATQITGNILFHSVPYLRKYDPASLEYWEYDKLGTYASAGCVRLTVADAKWIFDNCERGTKVEFYSSSDPGPLGKPAAKKISSNVECRNWDPTDSNPDNPWKNQSKKEENNNNSNKAEETQNKSENLNKTENNEYLNKSENTKTPSEATGSSNQEEKTTTPDKNNVTNSKAEDAEKSTENNSNSNKAENTTQPGIKDSNQTENNSNFNAQNSSEPENTQNPVENNVDSSKTKNNL